MHVLGLEMAIISMYPGIHGYPARWAWVRSAFSIHEFHGANTPKLKGWAWTYILLHGYPFDGWDPHVNDLDYATNLN